MRIPRDSAPRRWAGSLGVVRGLAAKTGRTRFSRRAPTGFAPPRASTGFAPRRAPPGLALPRAPTGLALPRAPTGLALLGLMIALLTSRASPASAAAEGPPEGPALTAARAALAEGDVFGWAFARAQHLEAGGTVEAGPWGALEDLAALLRCRALPPWTPIRDRSAVRAARAALRLEARRLERHLVDGAYGGTDLPLLVRAAGRLRLDPPEGPGLVRWPLEEERWPGERLEPRPAAPRCARPDAERTAGAARVRLEAEVEALARAAASIEALPPPTAVRVAVAYLEAAQAAGPDFVLPPNWVARFLRVAEAHEGRFARRALLLSARRLLDAGGPSPRLARALERLALSSDAEPLVRAAARVAWTRAVGDDPAARARSSDWSSTGEPAPPPPLRAWLDHVRARALLAQDALDALEVFGRAFVQRAGTSETDARTLDLLLDAQLRRPVARALAAAASFGEPRPAAVRKRWWSLGRRALDGDRVDLARAIFDRLWAEAQEDASSAPAELEEILAERARVAFAEGDMGGFVDLVDKLLGRLGTAEDRAARRAFAALLQDILQRLAAQRSEERRAQVAARLLDGIRALSEDGARKVDPRLEDAAKILAEWSGPWAEGRRPPRPSQRRDEKPARVLGEVVVQRAPPPLPPPKWALPPVVVQSFVVWADAKGAWRSGLPPEIRALGGGAGR